MGYCVAPFATTRNSTVAKKATVEPPLFVYRVWCAAKGLDEVPRLRIPKLPPSRKQLRLQVAALRETLNRLQHEKDMLEHEHVPALRKEVHRLQNEKDVLELEHVPALRREVDHLHHERNVLTQEHIPALRKQIDQLQHRRNVLEHEMVPALTDEREQLRRENDVMRFETIPGLNAVADRLHEARLELLRHPHAVADIVMLGDSLIDWGRWNKLLPELRILNRGVAGETSSGVLERMEEVIERQPKIVFLMIGTNDLTHGIPIDTVVANICRIIRWLRGASVVPIAHSIVYRAPPSDWKLNEVIAEVNDRLTALCEQEEVRFLDLNNLLAPDGLLLKEMTSDGLHLTPIAYRLWADAILDVLENVQVERPTISVGF